MIGPGDEKKINIEINKIGKKNIEIPNILKVISNIRLINFFLI